MTSLSQSEKIVLGIASQQFALAPIVDKLVLNTEYPLPTAVLLAMATAKTMYIAAVDFSGNDLSMFEISLDGFAQAFTQSGCAG